MDVDSVLTRYENSGHLARRSLPEELHESALRRPDHLAVVAHDGCLTYAELDRAIARSARDLAAAGVAEGDQVLVQLPNSVTYVVTLVALMRLAVVPTLMLPSHRQAEVRALARELHPVAYIGGRDQLGFDGVEMVEQMDPGELGLRMIWADGGERRDGAVPRLLLADPSADPEEDAPSALPWPSHRGTALNLLSGGTTSEPKIIPRVHEAYACNARAAARRCRVGPDTVYMAVLSTSHDLPLAQPGLLGTLLEGGTVVLCQSASFDEAFAAVEEHRVTLTAIVPAIAEVWYEASAWHPADLSSLEQIIIGASELDEDLGRGLMDRLGAVIQQGYGLGEGITTFTDLDDPVQVTLTTQGTPISEADILRIVDPQGNDLPPGEPGEVVQTGPYTFFGYAGSHGGTDCFDEDGFLRTGDRGYLTHDGDLVICGRVVEQINRLGENVSPQEVEQLLRQVPGVRSAAVLGIADSALGERTVAALVAEQEISREAVLEDFMTRGVARYKVPDQVIGVEAIPLTNIGKPDKRTLRSLIQGRADHHQQDRGDE
ncbi:MAG: AMP-binding protein [Brachybacterium sp.]|uniref:AMP-binding protein n=1 Tax=Brachybacterium sp. AOP35-5H-19 TaxID=3457685 RepID=UPI003FB74FB1